MQGVIIFFFGSGFLHQVDMVQVVMVQLDVVQVDMVQVHMVQVDMVEVVISCYPCYKVCDIKSRLKSQISCKTERS